jgi:hypothetical protein
MNMDIFLPRLLATHIRFVAIFSGLLLFAIAPQAIAKSESRVKGEPQARAVSAPELASFAAQTLALDLVRYGDRKKDPLALIQAVRMQQVLGTQIKVGSPLSNALLLQRARSYSQGRADLALLIDDAAASGSRGAQIGPILEHFLAPVNELQKLIVRFTGGVRATISLNAEEPQTLEIEVLDSVGKPVCIRSGAASRECSWTPSATSDYQIRIRNVGSSTSEFSVFHN